MHTLPSRSWGGQNEIDKQVPAAIRVMFAHLLQREKLHVSMRLRGAAMLARIEKGKQALVFAIRFIPPCL